MSEPEHNANKDKTQLSRESIVWLLLAVIANGGLVGWLVGLSESPLGAVVLPLLMTLVAGAGGFHFASGKVNTAAAKQLLLRSAQGTVAFMIACGIGVHFGIVLRGGGGDAPEKAEPPAIGAQELSQLSVPQIVRICAFQKKLSLLGVDRDGIDVFVAKYVEDCRQDAETRRIAGRPTAKDLDELEAALNAVSVELAKLEADDEPDAADATPAGGEPPDAAEEESDARLPGLRRGLPSVFVDLRERLPRYLGHLSNLKRLASASTGDIPKEHYRDFLENIEEDVSELIRFKEAPKLSVRNPPLDYSVFYGLALVLDVQKEPLVGDWDSDSKSLDSNDIELLDNTIKLFSDGDGSAEEADAPVRRRYAIKP